MAGGYFGASIPLIGRFSCHLPTLPSSHLPLTSEFLSLVGWV